MRACFASQGVPRPAALLAQDLAGVLRNLNPEAVLTDPLRLLWLQQRDRLPLATRSAESTLRRAARVATERLSALKCGPRPPCAAAQLLAAGRLPGDPALPLKRSVRFDDGEGGDSDLAVMGGEVRCTLVFLDDEAAALEGLMASAQAQAMAQGRRDARA